MKHGTESFLIKGEGLITGRLFSFSLLRWIFTAYQALCKPDEMRSPGDEELEPTPVPSRQFCRLFAKGTQDSSESLVELGRLMETEQGDPNDNRDSIIPAGYTYLGQFIDHDITLDRTELETEGQIDPDKLQNFRSPALDLDSVYLGGPSENPELYEADGKRFKIGLTSNVAGLGIFANDLPRLGAAASGEARPTDALIGDGRNDENLVVAQTHLAFLKFHNALVEANPDASFAEIRRRVVLHYQSIILTDFLPRVLDKDVLADVIANGRRFYTDDLAECMPVEFSVAAYRMGHSMVRPSYEWNRLFNSEGSEGIASFAQLFEFSGVSGRRRAGDPPFEGLPTLPSNWIVDWRRLYDFSALGEAPHPQLNLARKLDTHMALDLQSLPEFQQIQPPLPAPLLSLATRNLLRGRLLSLPSGQAVAEAMGITPLASEDIVRGTSADQAQTLRQQGLDTATPLWFYILREAMVQGDGHHLGALGSRIVAEVLVGLIQHSPVNLLVDQPDLTFSMPELLQADPSNINPLGD